MYSFDISNDQQDVSYNKENSTFFNVRVMMYYKNPKCRMPSQQRIYLVFEKATKEIAEHILC